MKPLGFLLIVIGLVALIYGGLTWTQSEEVLDLGPFEVRTEARRTLPLPPVLGAVCLTAGVVLVAVGARRPT